MLFVLHPSDRHLVSDSTEIKQNNYDMERMGTLPKYSPVVLMSWLNERRPNAPKIPENIKQFAKVFIHMKILHIPDHMKEKYPFSNKNCVTFSDMQQSAIVLFVDKLVWCLAIAFTTQRLDGAVLGVSKPVIALWYSHGLDVMKSTGIAHFTTTSFPVPDTKYGPYDFTNCLMQGLIFRFRPDGLDCIANLWNNNPILVDSDSDTDNEKKSGKGEKKSGKGEKKRGKGEKNRGSERKRRRLHHDATYKPGKTRTLHPDPKSQKAPR